MLTRKLVVEPPIVSAANTPAYCDRASTYSQYNYFGGFSARIKRRHFQIALEMTRTHFGRASVIDFGCADGFFLPSLARHFPRVVGIDRSPEHIEVAKQVIAHSGLANTRAVCNDGLSMSELRVLMPDQPFRIAFLLEVLEHVGTTPSTMYDEQLSLLCDVTRTLLEERCLVVASVPKMIGASFLLQRFGLAVLRLQREPLSLANLLRAGLFNDTSRLEPAWVWSCHLGFNHLKMERSIARRFRIVKRRDDVFQVLYALEPRS